MGKMLDELKSYTDIVKHILETDEKARNSDNHLYLQVLKLVADKHDIKLDELPVTTFLLHFNDYKFPNYKTIERTRRKIQELYPELSASDKVKEFRKDNEEDAITFSKTQKS
jgi:hypothetical protein